MDTVSDPGSPGRASMVGEDEDDDISLEDNLPEETSWDGSEEYEDER